MEGFKMLTREVDKKEAYRLRKSETTGMKAMVGKRIIIDVAAVYEDVNFKTGEPQDVCVIRDTDGNLYGTNSATFIREIMDMYDVFGEDLKEIEVRSGKAEKGDFIKPEII